jgi:2-dehydropantoate 2-reductase
MNILVYGAGVIGTLYAAQLQEGGHRVTVMARGARLADIRRHGLELEEVTTGARSITQVATTERLGADDGYEIALIAVRRDQLASAMPELTANQHVPTVLFMLNNPLGSAELTKALGSDRVLLGFPGAGGTLDGHIVRYVMIAQQPTTLGEFGGQRTQRLRSIAKAFRDSGFRTRTDRNMDAWLKAHAFFVTAISGAIYLAGGDCRRLSEDNAMLRLMISGVQEGFAVVRALGFTVTPFPLRVLFTWLPQAFAVHYWRRFLAADMADCVFGRHARAAPTEMREIANDCRILMRESGVDAFALRQLYSAIDGVAAHRTSEQTI